MPRKKSNGPISVSKIDCYAMRFTLEDSKKDEYLRKRFSTDEELERAYKLCKELQKEQKKDYKPYQMMMRKAEAARKKADKKAEKTIKKVR